jgi:hypothetical protein
VGDLGVKIHEMTGQYQVESTISIDEGNDNLADVGNVSY